MKLYRTTAGIFLENDSSVLLLDDDWDTLVNRDNLFDYLHGLAASPVSHDSLRERIDRHLLPPIGSQEVWAAGVTYLKSRDARMEESGQSGGADFYDKVYSAERPELFFKALPHRVAASGEAVYIRRDSEWNVPEPELTLFINSNGNVQGYTIGNDMSSRSIEGQNPLYLPQAKVYERSLALGPCLYVPRGPLSPATAISIRILRDGETMFADTIEINRIKRTFSELAEYLFRELVFPSGCYLLTGTGMVPPPSFSLATGDHIEIIIEGIGTLFNTVSTRTL